MKLPTVLFLVLVSTSLADAANRKTLLFQRETKTDYVELIPLKPLNLQAFTLCMRLATELKGHREVILFAYRTTYYDELNIWREFDGSIGVHLSGEPIFFMVPELAPMETHLCITWDSSSGAATVFVDGRKTQTKIYKPNHSISAGGNVLIGQDPDSYLGDFDAKQSFVGEMSDINMWDSVLSSTDIRNMYSENSILTPGNVFNWDDINLRVNGNVKVFQRNV